MSVSASEKKNPMTDENQGFVRNERIAGLRELVRPEKPELDIERLRLMTASYKETEGEPLLIRRAKALEAILDNKTIYIADGALIAGNQARTPGGVQLGCEYGAEWMLRDLDTFATRVGDRFYPRDDEKEEMRELLSYWIGKTVQARVGQVGNRIAKAMGREWQDNACIMGYGHMTVDYPKMIQKGVAGIKDEIASCIEKLDPLDNPEDIAKYEVYDAMNITLDAVVRYAGRYARYARELAEKESNPQRKWELEQIADNCDRVPGHPARNFWQALQSVWMVSVVLMIESPGYSYSPGRMDQYLYPFFRKDLAEGTITKEWAQELLEACFCTMNETLLLAPSETREGVNEAEALAGQPVTQNICLGGTDENGNDATNELSFLIVDADCGVRLIQPEIAVRLHKGISGSFLKRLAGHVRCGTGKPKFFVDEVVYKMFKGYGGHFLAEDLWDWVPAGCTEHNIPGRTIHMEHPSFGEILHRGTLLPLEAVLYQGRTRTSPGVQMDPETPDPRTFTSFEQFMDAFRVHCDYRSKFVVLMHIIEDDAQGQIAPTPFQSTLVADCIQRGKDATLGGARYNIVLSHGPLLFGIVNQANALAVIKKLVFEDKVITMDELIDALDRNWEDREDLRQMVINRVPKFGNDDDYVDSIMKELYEMAAEPGPRYETINRKARFGSGIAVVATNVPLGRITPATPDGRFAGDPLNDGGVSPQIGTDLNGPTAILNSMAKLDQPVCPQGGLWNLKLLPQTLEGDAGLDSLVHWIRAMIDSEVYHVQINCVTNETLRAAQKNPDRYRSLLVRIAGYSAYFTQIDKSVQDNIIARNEKANLGN